jgi:glutathione S-transferase
MMLMYNDTPFKSECYQITEKPDGGGMDFSCWFSAKPALKEKNPLINLPYIIDGDLIVTQSPACFSYLGRKLQMMGATPAEEAHCEMLLGECMDIRNKVCGIAYGGCEDLSGWFVKEQAASLGKLDAWLAAKYGGDKACDAPIPFFIGDKACTADFHIWEMCSQLTLLGKVFCDGLDPLAPYPCLSKFHVDFGALANNEKYLASDFAKLPMNNVMACFGSASDGSVFPLGTGATMDWNVATNGTY